MIRSDRSTYGLYWEDDEETLPPWPHHRVRLHNEGTRAPVSGLYGEDPIIDDDSFFGEHQRRRRTHSLDRNVPRFEFDRKASECERDTGS